MKKIVELMQIIVSFVIFSVSIFFLIRAGYFLDELSYVEEVREILLDGYGPFYWICFLFSGIQFVLSIINYFIKNKK